MGPMMAAKPDILQCSVCGVEYDAADLPELCPICDDERQYLASDGRQHWTDPAKFDGGIDVVELETDLWGLTVRGGVGIGQQAKVAVTPEGTVMVDVPAAINTAAVSAVSALGPMRAIIPSHPHMFGVQSLWASALGAPVYVSKVDTRWLGRRPEALRLWEGEIRPVSSITASQPGGHFPGSAVIHWPGADGRGVLLCGDTIGVNTDRTSASFMRSFPNRLPLSGAVATRIAAHVAERYDFERAYDNFYGRISHSARARITASADRHAAWARGDFDHLT